MGGVGLFAQRLEVDLSKLQATKNAAPFTKNYDDFLIMLPEFPANTDWTQINRIGAKAKYFDGDGKEIGQADGQAMVTLIYDPKGDIRGPGDGPGPNTPFKQFNVGGNSGSVHRDAGAAVRLTKAPGAILFQNSNANVKFIEVTEITFFRR